MTRLHTNYYCPTCGFVVSSGILHECIPSLQKHIVKLEAELAIMETTMRDNDVMLTQTQAELAVATRALELACVEWAYFGGYRGEDAAKKLADRVLYQARMETQRD